MYGGIYTPTGVRGRGAGTAGLMSALCFGTPLFCCVSHRGVNTQTHNDSCKHKEDKRLYCVTYASVVNIDVGGKKTGLLSLPVSGSVIE